MWKSQLVFVIVLCNMFTACSSGGIFDSRLMKAASDESTRSYFGQAVDIDGNTAIVGADSANFSGAAYIYEFDGTSWIEKVILKPRPDVTDAVRFGYSVSINGNIAVVGAPFESSSASETGAVYVYRKSESGWSTEPEVILTLGEYSIPHTWFGHSVASWAEYIIVGAPRDSSSFNEQGRAYVFHYEGTTWVEEDTLEAPDGMADDWFGWSVAIDEIPGYHAVALVGEHRDYNSELGYKTGAVYSFKRIDDRRKWKYEQKLVSDYVDPNPEPNPRFGWSVSIDEGTALIGAWGDSEIDSLAGAAYYFEYDTISFTWEKKQKLTDARTEKQDNYGFSVSIDGDTAIIGSSGDDNYAPGRTPNRYPDCGAIYRIIYSGTSWDDVTKYYASDTLAGAWFGRAVSIYGGRYVVGAPRHSGFYFRAGVIYFY